MFVRTLWMLAKKFVHVCSFALKLHDGTVCVAKRIFHVNVCVCSREGKEFRTVENESDQRGRERKKQHKRISVSYIISASFSSNCELTKIYHCFLSIVQPRNWRLHLVFYNADTNKSRNGNNKINIAKSTAAAVSIPATITMTHKLLPFCNRNYFIRMGYHH